MADQELLELLLEGVDAWNDWRNSDRPLESDSDDDESDDDDFFDVDPRLIDLRGADLSNKDLSRADLSQVDLSGAFLVNANLRLADLSLSDLSHTNLNLTNITSSNLSQTNFRYASFERANLSRSNLSSSNLNGAVLNDAILRHVVLSLASLRNAQLSNAILTGADLSGADLSGAILIRADLREAILSKALLVGTNLQESNLAAAVIAGAILADSNLSSSKGLESIKHRGPSTIGIDTIYKSAGQIPVSFLRGCGLKDWEIEAVKLYLPELSHEQATSIMYKVVELRSNPAIQFNSCFISYSSKNHAFAESIYARLQTKGVRCWFAPEDMKIGDKLRPRIDETIRIHDKLLLVLSAESVASQWVEQEVETALEKEREQGRTVLFPIRLDDSVMEIKTGWPALIKNTRHIGDFSKWKDHNSYSKAFERLLRDLKADSHA